ncbi:hypothetical protein [Methanobrevibacter ruminantium]|uniref:hypothetical protein n=1 Tax=Methanobrevibacter ruminantium TaxID=83816 RepID=UPI0026F1C06B|nr:hypothetical protein [Methanobrevibacter ruminantium]
MTSKEIENLNKEISKIENRILTMETYLESHPDDFAVELSLSNLKSRNDELKLELSFLQENRGEVVVNEDVNFHFSGRFVKNNSIFAPTLVKIIETYEEMITFISAALEFGVDNMQKHIDIDFKNDSSHFIKVSPGSFMLTFSPVVHEDNQSTLVPSLNKLSFEKFCELINYGENVEEIIQQIDIIGSQSILKYKKFIEILDKNELDMDIHEGDIENPKISISHEKAHNIYFNIKSFEEEEIKTEQIEKEGILYYINTDNKKCGIKFFDEDLGKPRKISSINFRDGLKSKVKEKVDSEVKVILEKTIKTSIGDENTAPIYDLVNIL